MDIPHHTSSEVTATQPHQVNRGHILKILLGFLLTAVCLYLAFRGLELGEVLNSLSRASYKGLPVYMALLVAFFWLKAVRWRLLLLPIAPFRTSELVSPMMIGFMGNNVLPAHLGEIIRVLMITRRHPLSKTAVFSTILIERLLDMVAILLFLLIGSQMLGNELPDWVGYGELILGVGCLAAVIGGALFGLFPNFFYRIALRVFSWAPEKLASTLLASVASAAQALELVRSPRILLAVVSISLLKWALMAAMVYVSLESLGLSLPIWASFLVVGVCAVAVTVPSAPGFFGVIQLGFWASLQFLGVNKVDAVASSVYYHLFQYIPVTLAGLYYLNRQGISLRQMSKLTDERREV